MKIAELDQRSPEWHEFRRNKIGASDAPAIMGKSPWTTPYQLWEKKMGLKQDTVNEAMKVGIKLEDTVRQQVEQKLGTKYHPRVAIHESMPWMIASLDGLSEDQSSIIEIKIANSSDHSLAQMNMVPEKYEYQLYHQMAVTNMPDVLYCSYNISLDQLIILPFFRDEEKIEKMIAKEKEFMQLMFNFDPPPLTEQDYETKIDPEWKYASEHWVIANKEARRWKVEEELSRKRLLQLCTRNSKGNGVKVQKIVRKGIIDYESIPQLQGIDLEQYRKEPIESWRISIE